MTNSHPFCRGKKAPLRKESIPCPSGSGSDGGIHRRPAGPSPIAYGYTGGVIRVGRPAMPRPLEWTRRAIFAAPGDRRPGNAFICGEWQDRSSCFTAMGKIPEAIAAYKNPRCRAFRPYAAPHRVRAKNCNRGRIFQARGGKPSFFELADLLLTYSGSLTDKGGN